MDDIKKVFREGEAGTKKGIRNADGHEDLSDKLGNAGDQARKELGNAGDDMRHNNDRSTDADRRL
jgi:hypothetical protein